MIDLAVLLCVWQRLELLDRTLESLIDQTDKDFKLYLVNNNPGYRNAVEVAVFRSKLDVCITHNQRNMGAFDKYRVAHMQIDNGARHTHYLVLDDDLLFPPDYIAQVKRAALPDAVVGWIVQHFDGDYWRRKPVEVGGSGAIVDGAGMIVPADVLADPGVLGIPYKMVNADNLWISYFSNHVKGYGLVRGDFYGLSKVKDGKDSWMAIKQEKSVFLEDLRQKGWKV